MKKQMIMMVSLLFSIAQAETPKLTVIFVIDQLAYHYFNKLTPYFTGGIKWLKDRGVFYTNTIMPHGIPATSVGHTALNTGAWAKDHGIINNNWVNGAGETVECEQDNRGDNKVFSPDGLYDYGISPHHILVNGLSDYFAAASTNRDPHHAYSISLKCRSAVCTANKGGKAIWFDAQTGQFTSSTFYFDSLPDWLTAFNLKHQLNNLQEYTWELVHDPKSDSYDFANINNYLYSQIQSPLINVALTKDTDRELPFLEELQYTPFMGKMTFEVAKECINTILQPNTPDKLLLWVCIGGLDKIGHIYGSHTQEIIDMIYHIDSHLQDFIDFIEKKVGISHTLFVLTSDHGIVSTPEIARQAGDTNAQRIDIHTLCTEINDFVKCKYNISDWQTKISDSNIYFTNPSFATLDQAVRETVLKDIVLFLQQKSYIKNAWTYEQLSKQYWPKDSIESLLKNQLYPNRSGSIIMLTQPHVLVTKRKEGVDHISPYQQNTHIPLILYLPGVIENKVVTKPTSILQLPKTLAHIVGCDLPDVAPRAMLPELFE